MNRALLVLLSACVLVAACGDEPEPTVEETVEPTVMTSATASVTTLATGTPATGSPTTTATSTAATGTLEPGTPAPPSEPVASTYYLPTEQLPVVRFEAAEGPAELAVEVPPPGEYGIGLSGRTSLGERGMLFYREDFGTTGFWMRNTHIDLDIAFVSADREIVHITTMIADTDDIHRPDEAFVVAIEAPAGWYATHGIAEGDTVEYLFDLEATVPG